MIICVLCGANTADDAEYCPRHGCGAALAAQDLYSRNAVQIGLGVRPLVAVMPGEAVTVPVRVRNAGSGPAKFTVSTVGFPGDLGAGWAAVETPALSLPPGGLGSATLRLAPPRTASAPAGRRVVTIEAACADLPHIRARAELRVDVLPFADIDARVVPGYLRLRRTARTTLTVVNTGTAVLRIEAVAASDTRAVSLTCAGGTAEAEPGARVDLPVDVRAVRRRVAGRDAEHAAEVIVHSRRADDGAPVERVAPVKVAVRPYLALPRPPAHRAGPGASTSPGLSVVSGMMAVQRQPGADRIPGAPARAPRLRGVPRGVAVSCVVVAFVVSALLTAGVSGLFGGGGRPAAATGSGGGAARTAGPRADAGPREVSASPRPAATGPSAATVTAPAPPPAGAHGTTSPAGAAAPPTGAPRAGGGAAGGGTHLSADGATTAPAAVPDPGAIPVPDVTGAPVTSAEAQLKAAGFTNVRVGPAVGSTLAVGTVASTEPRAGNYTGSGSAVVLYTSAGPASAGTSGG